MSRRTPLAIAFLESRPLSAAKALAGLDREQAAVFLDHVPSRIIAPVFAQMSVRPASELLAQLKPVTAAAIVRQIDFGAGVALLRLAPDDARAAILSGMDMRTRRGFEMSLSFPAGSVGASMTSAIFALAGERTVEDARQEIRRSPRSCAEAVFVVDDDRLVIGIVAATALLRAAGDSLLRDVMDSDVLALSAHARLAPIAGLDAWGQHLALPVISRRRHLVGALTRATVARETAGWEDMPGSGSGSIAVALAESWCASLLGIGALLLGERAPEDGTS